LTRELWYIVNNRPLRCANNENQSIFLEQTFVRVKNPSQINTLRHCLNVSNEFLEMRFICLLFYTDGYFFVGIRFLNFYTDYQRLLILRIINITAKCIITETYYCKRLYLKGVLIKPVYSSLGCQW